VRLPSSIDHQVEWLDARPDAGMIYGRAFYGDGHCNPKGDYYPDHCPEEISTGSCLSGILFRARLSSSGARACCVDFKTKPLPALKIGICGMAQPGKRVLAEELVLSQEIV
jgi:hypothetical protein